ncbi:hypothetical protein KCU61_g143, partial [Aureobasidium melanogenum]
LEVSAKQLRMPQAADAALFHISDSLRTSIRRVRKKQCMTGLPLSHVEILKNKDPVHPVLAVQDMEHQLKGCHNAEYHDTYTHKSTESHEDSALGIFCDACRDNVIEIIDEEGDESFAGGSIIADLPIRGWLRCMLQAVRKDGEYDSHIHTHDSTDGSPRSAFVMVIRQCSFAESFEDGAEQYKTCDEEAETDDPEYSHQSVTRTIHNTVVFGA